MTKLPERYRKALARSRRQLTSYRATIDGRPIAFARTTNLEDGRRITPARYRRWKSNAARQLTGGGTFPGEVAIKLTIFADRIELAIESLRDRTIRPKGVTGDLDNYAKAVLDALTDAQIITDDDQVAALDVVFGQEARP